MGAPLLLRALFKRPSPQAQAGFSAGYRLARIDAGHVRRYRAAFGIKGEHLPLPYLYLIAQRAQLAAMLDRPLPFRIPGLIHIDNDLRLHATVEPGQALDLVTELRMQEPAPNGAVHALLETRALDRERLVFSCASTYLVRRGARREGGAPQPAAPPGREIGRWLLAPDAGRRYAALSGDWNPIHLWPWSARLMGMRSPIIHGAHTMAAACARIEAETGRAVARLRCRFRQPVALGSELTLFLDAADGAFAAVCGERIAVEGAALDGV
ncbi:hypothetical protein B0920_20030 [Massilia sp. KIM]|nr:hypothetical protein B0920_20030 [Massilia sp. KIM]